MRRCLERRILIVDAGQLRRITPDVVVLCSKAVIKYVVMRRPIFENEYYQSNLLTASGDKDQQCRK
jgi:hypothetical protein